MPFVPRYSPDPIRNYEIEELLAEYDPTAPYKPMFPNPKSERFLAPGGRIYRVGPHGERIYEDSLR